MVGFIGKEYMLPLQYERWEIYGERQAQQRMCIMCYKQEVTKRMYAMARSGIQPVKPIHDHVVETNVEYQYDARECLPVSIQMNDGRKILTGIVGAFPEFHDYMYEHNVRKDPDTGAEIRFIRRHPAKAGF